MDCWFQKRGQYETVGSKLTKELGILLATLRPMGNNPEDRFAPKGETRL